MGDDCIGSIQNGLGGAVILLQADDPGTPVLLLEGQNVLNGGTAEAVDALVIVADDTDILIAVSQQAGKQILNMVGILILVHQHIAELVLIVPAHILVLLQQADRNTDNIVEIQGVILFQPCLVFAVGLGDMENPKVVGLLRPLQKFLGGGQVVLFLADGIENHLGGESLVIQSHILDDILHDPLGIRGIVDGKASAVTHPFDFPAEDTAAGGVEGHGPDVLGFGAKQDGKPLFQFIGGLVGKGNGNDAPGGGGTQGAKPVSPVPVKFGAVIGEIFQEFHIFFRDRIGNLVAVSGAAKAHDVGNAVDQNCGLTAAGTGQKQQGAVGG